MQSRDCVPIPRLRSNLKIALHTLRIPRLCSNLEIAQILRLHGTEVSNVAHTVSYTAMFMVTWCHSECCVPSALDFEDAGGSVVCPIIFAMRHQAAVIITWTVDKCKNTRNSAHHPTLMTCI